MGPETPSCSEYGNCHLYRGMVPWCDKSLHSQTAIAITTATGRSRHPTGLSRNGSPRACGFNEEKVAATNCGTSTKISGISNISSIIQCIVIYINSGISDIIIKLYHVISSYQCELWLSDRTCNINKKNDIKFNASDTSKNNMQYNAVKATRKTY